MTLLWNKTNEPTLDTTLNAHLAICHPSSSWVADTLHYPTELENPRNGCLDSLFLDSFTSAQRLHTTYVYKIEMTIKANQNRATKPTASLLYVVQNMNKTERHKHTQTLHRTPYLRICPWHSPPLILSTSSSKPLRTLHLLTFVESSIFYSSCNVPLDSQLLSIAIVSNRTLIRQCCFNLPITLTIV